MGLIEKGEASNGQFAKIIFYDYRIGLHIRDRNDMGEPIDRVYDGIEGELEGFYEDRFSKKDSNVEYVNFCIALRDVDTGERYYIKLFKYSYDTWNVLNRFLTVLPSLAGNNMLKIVCTKTVDDDYYNWFIFLNGVCLKQKFSRKIDGETLGFVAGKDPRNEQARDKCINSWMQKVIEMNTYEVSIKSQEKEEEVPF